MEKLTLEERIARAARSQAASPEAAARMVERLAQLHIAYIFHGSADFELMYELIGPYMEQMGDDLLHYAGFCYSINLALMDDEPPAGADSRFRPAMGTQVSNALVLLALMLLDQAKGRGMGKEVYHCTRMTLEQYLDALEALAFQGAEEPKLHFQEWRHSFLSCYPSFTPLADVPGDLLRGYIRGWKQLDYLEHILRCIEDLSSELAGKKPEQCPSLVDYYYNLALAYSWDAPDPAREAVKVGEVRRMILLPDRDYSPQAVERLMEQAPTPEFRGLLEQFISKRWLISGMSHVNRTVSCLFMLWVGPYLWMGEHPQ